MSCGRLDNVHCLQHSDEMGLDAAQTTNWHPDLDMISELARRLAIVETTVKNPKDKGYPF